MRKGECLTAARAALAGKGAVVVGLGSTGISVARFLSKCGARVVATDSKKAEAIPGIDALAGVEVRAGGHSGITVEGVDLVVVSPGVPYELPLLVEARANGAEGISEVELAWRFMDAPVSAVAGTNGKTTTTALLGEVLENAGFKVFVGGNIGTPAIEYIENGGGADHCVLEISSFHLETTRCFNPHIGILLNITEDHLDRYRDFGHYAETKMRLFENQSEDDYAIININDPEITKRRMPGRGRRVPFTTEGRAREGLYLEGGSIVHLFNGTKEEYAVEGIKLKGIHNIENVMSVIAAARRAGASKEVISRTLSVFSGLHHRMEIVREFGGVRYIDDSKGTNIGALMMALKGLGGPGGLGTGGGDKGGDYRALSGLIKEKVKLLVLLGEARFKINEALGEITKTVRVDWYGQGGKGGP